MIQLKRLPKFSSEFRGDPEPNDELNLWQILKMNQVLQICPLPSALAFLEQFLRKISLKKKKFLNAQVLLT